MNQTVSKIITQTRCIYEKISPYIHVSRIKKPTGIFLIWFPCLWGLAFQDMTTQNFLAGIILYFLGALSLRTVGCIINDIFDKDFDVQVSRTKSRPLAKGSLSTQQAIIFGLLMLVPGFFVFLNLSNTGQIIALIAFFGAILYPLCKRFTHWPQLVLGIVFNSGLWVSGYGHTTILNLALLYIAGICWTLAYDTIYAFQDIEDDMKIGLGSTAIRFQNYPLLAVGSFYLVMICSLWILGMYQGATNIYYVSLGLLGIFLLIAVLLWDPKHHNQCLQFFKHNTIVGLIIFYLVLLLH